MTVLVECDVSMLSFESETDRCMNPAAMETVVVARLTVRPIGGAVTQILFSHLLTFSIKKK